MDYMGPLLVEERLPTEQREQLIYVNNKNR
jgi:hypothetical protein